MTFDVIDYLSFFYLDFQVSTFCIFSLYNELGAVGIGLEKCYLQTLYLSSYSFSTAVEGQLVS